MQIAATTPTARPSATEPTLAVDLGGLPTLDGGITGHGLLFLAEPDALAGDPGAVSVRGLRLSHVLEVQHDDGEGIPWGHSLDGSRLVRLRFGGDGQPAAVRSIELLADGALPALLHSQVPVRADLVAGALLAAARVEPTALRGLGTRGELVREALEVVNDRFGGADAWFRKAGATPGVTISWRALFVRRPSLY